MSSTPWFGMGIVASEMSGWVFIPSNMSGAHLQGLILPKACHTLHFAAPPTTTIWHHKDNVSLETVCGQAPVEVLCFEGCARPPRTSSNIWREDSGVQIVISERTSRDGTHVSWQQESRQFCHALLGGVTNWQATLHCYTKADCPRLKDRDSPFFKTEFLVGAPTSITNLTDRTAQGRPCSPPTTSTTSKTSDKSEGNLLINLQVLQSSATRKTSVVKVPSVFSPTKWCVRPLSDTEVALALDLPGTRFRLWKMPMLQAVNKQLQTPIKVTAMLARCMRASLRTLDSTTRISTKRRISEEEDTNKSGLTVTPSDPPTRLPKRLR
ncbi:hypothetical protein ACA910_012933 [Epithemia clementina (nom. ined.)]